MSWSPLLYGPMHQRCATVAGSGTLRPIFPRSPESIDAQRTTTIHTTRLYLRASPRGDFRMEWGKHLERSDKQIDSLMLEVGRWNVPNMPVCRASKQQDQQRITKVILSQACQIRKLKTDHEKSELLQTRSCHHKLSLQLWVWISRPRSSWRFLHHRFLNIRSIPASHPTHTLLRTAVRCRPCLPPERNNSPRPPDHEGLPPHACGTDAHHRILLSNFPIQTSPDLLQGSPPPEKNG